MSFFYGRRSSRYVFFLSISVFYATIGREKCINKSPGSIDRQPPDFTVALFSRWLPVEQFGDRNGRLSSPHRFCELHDIAVRLVGGFEAGHPLHAVRVVQGRSAGRSDVRSSHLGGHWRTAVLGRRTHHKHVVLDRCRHHAHHFRRRALR